MLDNFSNVPFLLALWAGGHDRCRMCSSHGNGLYLDQRARHPQAPTDSGACRVGGCEERPVDLVISAVMTPVGQHHRGLDHLVQPETGQGENCLKSREDVPGLGPNVAWTYQTPLGIETGMAADKHEVPDAYPVWTGNLRSELVRLNHVRMVFLARLPNLCEGRVDGEPWGGQGRHRLNFDEESLTPQTSLESRVGREGRLHMIPRDLIVLPIGMPVGECHLGLHQVSQRATGFLQCDGHIG